MGIQRLIIPLVILGTLLLPVSADAQVTGSDASDRGPMLTAQIGAGSLRGWDFASLPFEVFPGDQEEVGVFAVAGLGTIMIGAGVAYYSNLRGTGLTASAVAGLAGAHINGGGRLAIDRLGFLTAGVGYGSYFLQHHGLLPYLSWERPF